VISVDKLPLLRVAEVAFLTPKLEECVEFYRRLGLEYPTHVDATKIQFAEVGEQLFGFAHEKRGFFDGYGGFVKAPFHVAFEVSFDQLDECIAFLVSKRIKTSPKIENSRGWHGAQRSTSVYFHDPTGNIMELWAPSKQENTRSTP
jgi:catechol 2,3-dioxygenase-like lactoylglutathione lyase family enzyme